MSAMSGIPNMPPEAGEMPENSAYSADRNGLTSAECFSWIEDTRFLQQQHECFPYFAGLKRGFLYGDDHLHAVSQSLTLYQQAQRFQDAPPYPVAFHRLRDCPRRNNDRESGGSGVAAVHADGKSAIMPCPGPGIYRRNGARASQPLVLLERHLYRESAAPPRASPCEYFSA